MRQEWANLDFYFEMQSMLAHTRQFTNLRFLVIGGLSVIPDDPLWQDDRDCPDHTLLLDASQSRALSTSSILMHDAFKSLIFLDLSGITLSANFALQCSAGSFPNLRILKLRGMGLTDSALPNVLLYSNCQIWSLDVRDNNLTDEGISVLCQLSCLRNIHPAMLSPWPEEERSSGVNLFDFPPRYSKHQPREFEDFDNSCVPLRPDGKANFVSLLKRKDWRKDSLLAQHEKPVLSNNDDLLYRTGLTQLYVSENKLTSDGIRRILSGTNRLQVLDAGSVKLTGRSPIPHVTCLWQPSSTAALQQSTCTRMEVLRIHHSIVTYCPTFMSSSATGYTLPHLFRAEKNYGPSQQSTWTAFMPSQNHRLRELTLTHLPNKSYGFIIDQLKLFLKDAALQEQALSGASQHRRAPKSLSGLKQLTLELIKDYDPLLKTFRGLSISGDEDSKKFHQESEKDFSFFSDENEGASSSKMASDKHPAAVCGDTVDDVEHEEADRKSANPDDEMDITTLQLFDVVEELKKFRATAVPVWSGTLRIVQTWR
jgi:hypothetical protein